MIIIILIIILSFLLRIYDLGGENLWFDESTTVYTARQSISEVLANKDIHNLYYAIIHFWIKLFGDSEFSVRFPSVIFGVLSIYVIYRLGEQIFNTKVGLLSAFVLSISTYHIRYSQEARPYSLLLLAVLVSNYYFIKILRDNKLRDNKIDKIKYLISSVIMIYSHVFGLFYLICQNIYYLIEKGEGKGRPNVKSWIGIQFIILLSIVLWMPMLLKDITGSIQENQNNPAIKIFPSFNFIYGTFILFVGSEQILYLFIITIILGLIIGLSEYKNDGYKDKKFEYMQYIFAIIWLFIPIMMGFLVSYIMKRPSYSIYSRYFIASSPVLILIFSKFVTNIITIKKGIFAAVMISFVLIFQISLMDQYYVGVDKERWKDVANYVIENKKDGDIVLLYPEFGRIPFGYYYKLPNYIGVNNSSEVYNIINEDKNNKNRIWLIFSHINMPGRDTESKLIEEILSEKYYEKDVRQFSGIRKIKITFYER